jgi:hypothetical protein
MMNVRNGKEYREFTQTNVMGFPFTWFKSDDFGDWEAHSTNHEQKIVTSRQIYSNIFTSHKQTAGKNRSKKMVNELFENVA